MPAWVVPRFENHHTNGLRGINTRTYIETTRFPRALCKFHIPFQKPPPIRSVIVSISPVPILSVVDLDLKPASPVSQKSNSQTPRSRKE
ncbi:hypothetical protein VTJ04DRAFT_281 [Mycothermus thermophilus]|uniref:uncharacterized protein n=1 Tax=Humicola insolens TaxID=85995 RepID=UPI0037444A9D